MTLVWRTVPIIDRPMSLPAFHGFLKDHQRLEIHVTLVVIFHFYLAVVDRPENCMISDPFNSIYSPPCITSRHSCTSLV